MADPVPEPGPAKRPVLSPDPEQTWRPGPRRRAQFEERRPFWHLEMSQYVLALIVVLCLVVLVIAGLLLSSMFSAATAGG